MSCDSVSGLERDVKTVQIDRIPPRAVERDANQCCLVTEVHNWTVQPQRMTGGLKFGFRKLRDCTIYVVKTKELICAFVFAYVKIGFLMTWLKLLAHLSRRLKGELIVYRSIRRPCVR